MLLSEAEYRRQILGIRPPVPNAPQIADASKITYQQIKDLFNTIPLNDLARTERFVSGDHWQEGWGWIGWQPDSTSDAAQKQFALVGRLFNAKNVIGGMVKRVRGASLGKEPDWQIVPAQRQEPAPPEPVTDPLAPSKPAVPQETPEEKAFKVVDESLVRWWDKKKVHRVLKEFVAAKAAYGKAAIRIYIPPGFVENGNVTAADLDEALDKISVEVPHYTAVVDGKDRDFGQEFTVLKVGKSQTDGTASFEVCHLDQQGKTNIRVVQGDSATFGGIEDAFSVENGTGVPSPAPKPPEAISVDLRGNLLTRVEGDYGDALISETVRQQQRAVNHAKTGESFALANINFPEVTFINADLPTETISATDGKPVQVTKNQIQGPGMWRNLIGRLTYDATGNERLATPDVKFRDNADPEKFAKVADNNTRDMHQEAGMLYIYLADSEYASGNARVEAMTDYLILLIDAKTMIDNIGVWLLTSVLRLAYNFAGKPEADLEDFKVIFSSKITLGRVSNEDKAQMLEEVNAGLRAKRNYMVAAEVTDDPTSELAVIATDGPLKTAGPDPLVMLQAQAKIAEKQNSGGNGNGNGGGAGWKAANAAA
jgi:hypothetical protein